MEESMKEAGADKYLNKSAAHEEVVETIRQLANIKNEK
jgi:DNA-binding NarL/FixJ family response regulator